MDEDVNIAPTKHPSVDENEGLSNPSASPRRESPGDPTPQCSQDSCCIDQNDENKFQCNKCLRHVHFRCTSLPTYQIAHFLSKNYRNFICIKCTQVPEHLNNVIPRPPPRTKSQEIAELEATVKSKETEVEVLAETNRILQGKIKQLSVQLDKTVSTLHKNKEDSTKLSKETKVMKNGILTYEKEVTSLKSTISELEKRITDINTKDESGDQTIENLTNLMSRKFLEVENNLKESIRAEVSKRNQDFEEKIHEISKTYAESVGNSSSITSKQANDIPDIRSIMREEQNELLAEESDKKLRSCNFILHGTEDSCSADRKKKDEEIVANFFNDLSLDLTYKTVFRIGTYRGEQSKRPIKVTMKNEMDKDSIMANLRKLKGKENYKGVSVTDDHTIKDRNLIKEWAEKAKLANEEEPDDSLYEWKVRGSPKNGLRLKKFRKRVLSQQL